MRLVDVSEGAWSGHTNPGSASSHVSDEAFLWITPQLLLGVSRRTIYNRIRESRLQTIRTAGGSQRVLVESLVTLTARAVDVDDTTART